MWIGPPTDDETANIECRLTDAASGGEIGVVFFSLAAGFAAHVKNVGKFILIEMPQRVRSSLKPVRFRAAGWGAEFAGREPAALLGCGRTGSIPSPG
jgi:hypothetical protein